MQSHRFPHPIHIVSNGDALHAIVLDRVAVDHDVSMSITIDNSGGRPQRPRARNWVTRQLELDGIPGLVRDAIARGRPGLRYARSKINAKHNTDTVRRSDEQFLRLLSIPPAKTVMSPSSVGTLITFGGPAAGSPRHDIASDQQLHVHIGWPAQPNRDGVISALTHRNVDSLCAVIEAVGPVEGFAMAHPPLGRDDDPCRIHQRLVALAASMLSDVLNSPGAALVAEKPNTCLRTPLLDRQAVSSDARSGRLRETIAAVARF